MGITILKSGLIFDGRSEELVEGGSIVIENDKIREVSAGDVRMNGATVIDMDGRFVMPGLIDAHFHVYSISLNMQLVDSMTMPVKVAYAARLLKGTLHRGFTTVRDPGGGEIGLHLAISQGLMDGPRLYYGVKSLSQTGGHGDMRPADHVESPCGCVANLTFTEVVDGVDNVRKFCRNELRKGADHIKIFISGGVASPTDPIWMPQYTDEEIEAAVYEARTRRKYESRAVIDPGQPRSRAGVDLRHRARAPGMLGTSAGGLDRGRSSPARRPMRLSGRRCTDKRGSNVPKNVRPC